MELLKFERWFNQGDWIWELRRTYARTTYPIVNGFYNRSIKHPTISPALEWFLVNGISLHADLLRMLASGVKLTAADIRKYHAEMTDTVVEVSTLAQYEFVRRIKLCDS